MQATEKRETESHPTTKKQLTSNAKKKRKPHTGTGRKTEAKRGKLVKK